MMRCSFKLKVVLLSSCPFTSSQYDVISFLFKWLPKTIRLVACGDNGTIVFGVEVIEFVSPVMHDGVAVVLISTPSSIWKRGSRSVRTSGVSISVRMPW